MLWACLMGIQPADSAGWRLKQCSILSVAARCWLVSVITSSGGWLPLYKRYRAIEPVLNEVFRVAQ